MESPHSILKKVFGYDSFRPGQEEIVSRLLAGQDVLAVMPTGAGKSICYQVPALLLPGITIVVSPLVSLMKDQVGALVQAGVAAAFLNNSLTDNQKALMLRRAREGWYKIIYVAPERLEMPGFQRFAQEREISMVTVDEAHCISQWGQDFRPSYLRIKAFVDSLPSRPVVGAFTATATAHVRDDIREQLALQKPYEVTTSFDRPNLYFETRRALPSQKPKELLDLVLKEGSNAGIVYCSTTRQVDETARLLQSRGIRAAAYHAKLDADTRRQNQDDFLYDRVQVMVATNAFGMGVDKKDVGLVIHYDISDSLENYIQEAGRAGRDPHLSAKCYVLYSDEDLDKHFILLNQTKLSISEIQQVWKAVKDFTKLRPNVSCSALEIARQAGWDDSVSDIETRVRTALSALEQSGYIERGNNVPHVYATGITVKNMDEARLRLAESPLFSEEEMQNAIRIIKSLITQKYIAKAQDSEAESRIDYLADILGLSKRDVISSVDRMRQEGILANTRDISAYLQDVSDKQRKSQQMLEKFAKLERYILEHIPDESLHITYKQLNNNAVNDGISTSTEKQIRTLLYFLVVKGYARKKEDGARSLIVTREKDLETMIKRFERRVEVCRFIIERLYSLAEENKKTVESIRSSSEEKGETRESALGKASGSTIFGRRTSERSEIQQAVALLQLLFLAVGRRGGSLALSLQDRSHEAGGRISGTLQCDGDSPHQRVSPALQAGRLSDAQ